MIGLSLRLEERGVRMAASRTGLGRNIRGLRSAREITCRVGHATPHLIACEAATSRRRLSRDSMFVPAVAFRWMIGFQCRNGSQGFGSNATSPYAMCTKPSTRLLGF